MPVLDWLVNLTIRCIPYFSLFSSQRCLETFRWKPNASVFKAFPNFLLLVVVAVGGLLAVSDIVIRYTTNFSNSVVRHKLIQNYPGSQSFCMIETLRPTSMRYLSYRLASTILWCRHHSSAGCRTWKNSPSTAIRRIYTKLQSWS